MRGCDNTLNMSIPHALEWFQHLTESFSAHTVLLQGIDANLPVITDCYISSSLFRPLLTRVGGEEINCINFSLIIRLQLMGVNMRSTIIYKLLFA